MTYKSVLNSSHYHNQSCDFKRNFNDNCACFSLHKTEKQTGKQNRKPNGNPNGKTGMHSDIHNSDVPIIN